MISRDRLRVALISFNYGEYCVRLASALSREAEVLLVLPHAQVAPHISKLDEAVQLFPFHNFRLRQPLHQFWAIREIIRRIHAFSPDVIHYQGAHLWFGLALPWLRRYPLVLTIHDFRPHLGDRPSKKLPDWIETFARRRADELIVHSRHIRELAIRRLHFNPKRVSVIPHIQIGEDLCPPGVEEEEHSILFFGRIWPYKGLGHLIRAEPLISARVPDLRIVIAGEGENLSTYKRMMVHPKRFLVHSGYIPESRVAGFFQRASVVVLPYVEASQSGVIPHAYSAGKPVVATTVGGLPEMVENGRTGYLVAPRSATQLAKAITRLLLDKTLRHQMGANAKRKIEVECAPPLIGRKTLEVYRRAVENTAQAPVSELGGASALANVFREPAPVFEGERVVVHELLPAVRKSS